MNKKQREYEEKWDESIGAVVLDTDELGRDTFVLPAFKINGVYYGAVDTTRFSVIEFEGNFLLKLKRYGQKI